MIDVFSVLVVSRIYPEVVKLVLKGEMRCVGDEGRERTEGRRGRAAVGIVRGRDVFVGLVGWKPWTDLNSLFLFSHVETGVPPMMCSACRLSSPKTTHKKG
jgi:hypothetical protein